MTDSPGDQHRADAARLAGGSTIVLAGGVVDKFLRLCVTVLLSGALGPAAFGAYQNALRVAAWLAAIAPLGLDTGVVYFGARFHAARDPARLKGLMLTGIGISLVCGVLGSAAMWAAATFGPWWHDEPDAERALKLMAPVIAAWTPLFFSVGAARAFKEVRWSTFSMQVVLPGALLAGCAVTVLLLGWGYAGAVFSAVLATTIGACVSAFFAWRLVRRVIGDDRARPIFEFRRLLAYSLPQGFTAGAFKLNVSLDVLMLGWLSTMDEVGVYAVAASLAALGSMPTNAVTSMFNPFIAELAEKGEPERLDALLKLVTRWLVIVAMPFYVLLAMVPDLALGVFDPVYGAALVPLMLLLVGQAVNMVAAPAMQIIPMTGHSLLNLVNALAALGLLTVLSYVLVPEYGSVGSALANAVTLASWSAWRMIEVWLLMRCFPMARRTLGLLAIAVGGCIAVWGSVLAFTGVDGAFGHSGMAARGVGALVVLAAFYGGVAVFGRTADDGFVVDRLKARLRGILRR